MREKALNGVKVIELCQMVAGPFCSKLLADLGAEVIKIEDPDRGDAARHRGPFSNDIPHREHSGLFSYLNMNKLSITLNMQKPQGRDILTDLIRTPGAILIVDKPPQVLKQLELSYDNLKRVSKELIVTSITPFGLTGKYRDYKAYPLNVAHGGGEGYCLPGGEQYLHRPPLKIGRFVVEYDAGLNAAVGSLAALYFRNMSGLGQLVDISKQESVMSLYSSWIPRFANEGLLVNRANQGYPFGGILECKDGYVAIICWFERDWQALVKLMGSPEWARESRFKDSVSRALHGEEINALMLEWTMKHTNDEIYHMGQAVGCAVGKVYTAEDLINCEQLSSRGFFVEVEHPDMGRLKYPSAPYRFSETPWAVERPAPRLGEHNRHIYCERLGYDKARLLALEKAGVI